MNGLDTTPGGQLCDYEDLEFDPSKFPGTGTINGADLNTNVSSPAGGLGDLSGLGSMSNFSKNMGGLGSNQLQYTGVMTTGFKDFLFKPELLRAITDCGFEHPSEVQQECIPQAMMGTDIICQAKSGMGKTAVFVLTTLQQLDEPKPISLLVMCHTRELAFQIKSEFTRFMKYLDKEKYTCEVMYGGQPINEHIKLLKKSPPTILIGTPGRILSLVKGKHLKMENLKHFVLDECDQMLEALDMRRDVQNIFKSTPHEKQVMMYSATFKPDVRNICRMFMKNPYEIQIDNEQRLTLHGLKQYYTKLDEEKKNRKLVDLLDSLQFNQVIIFVSQVKRADALSKLLLNQGFPSVCMHSGLKQEERLKRYQEFKEFKKRLMVSTDIFGRGIDMGKVNVVINYDMPVQMENAVDGRASDQYLHRVGRAGRFGTKGLTISFIASTEDQTVLLDIQKRFEVKMEDLPSSIDQSTYMNA